jgi:chemotaxis protein CheX
MDLDSVNPFVESDYSLFSTMLGVRVVRTGLTMSAKLKRPQEVMGLIGFSGMMRGTVALAMPHATSMAMVQCLLGTETLPDSETISDGVAEMVNIVAGQAKAKLSLKVNQTLELSLPVVLHGDSYEVFSPSEAVWLEIPFESELGPITVRLNFQRSATG